MTIVRALYVQPIEIFTRKSCSSLTQPNKILQKERPCLNSKAYKMIPRQKVTLVMDSSIH